MSETTTPKPQPFDKVRSMNGKFTIPIWRNVDDEGRARFSLTEHECTYYDKTAKQYKSTTTVFDNDAAELAATYADARDRMKIHREAEYKQWKANHPSSSNPPPANQAELAKEEQAT